MSQPWTVLVVGPGALGSLLAARLEKEGAKPYLLARNEERAKTIRNHGITVRWQDSEQKLSCPILCPETLEEDIAGLTFSLIICCVKSIAFQDAMKTVARVPGDASLLVFQNGLLWPDIVTQYIDECRVLGAMTTEAALRMESDDGLTVFHKGQGVTRLAFLGRKRSSEFDALSHLFQQVGMSCEFEESLLGMLWDKAIVNAAINALTALLLIPNGALLENDASASLADRAAEEACRVADALGIQRSVEADQWRVIAKRTTGNGSSTLQDVVAQRRTEVNAINGVIAEKGRVVGVDVTVNDLLTNLIAAREGNYRRSASMVNVDWTLQ
ncbi:MAG: 2-dehydropantoate 2-reductase [Planctomycetota bacterium]|nr:2-dehydropantoate 2-reductase [Planctomycetota bacterium]